MTVGRTSESPVEYYQFTFRMSIANDDAPPAPENDTARPRRRASSFLHLHIPEPAASWTAGVRSAITLHETSTGHHGFGSHLHLPLPTFTITGPDADGSGVSVGRRFSFGLRRFSQTVSRAVKNDCVKLPLTLKYSPFTAWVSSV